jgi:hypothetical protein
MRVSRGRNGGPGKCGNVGIAFWKEGDKIHVTLPDDEKVGRGDHFYLKPTDRLYNHLNKLLEAYVNG